MALPDWIARRSLVALNVAAGLEQYWPQDVEPAPTADELARAHAVIAQRSAIRD